MRSQSHGRNATDEMYEMHTNRTHTAHNHIAFRRHLRVQQRRHNQPIFRTCEGQAYWYPWVPSGEAGRGCRRVPQRQEPAQPLPLPERLGGTNKLTSSGHHSQRCCFHSDRPTHTAREPAEPLPLPVRLGGTNKATSSRPLDTTHSAAVFIPTDQHTHNNHTHNHVRVR